MQKAGLFKLKLSQPGQTEPVDQHPVTDPSARAVGVGSEFCSRRASKPNFGPSPCSLGSREVCGEETLRETCQKQTRKTLARLTPSPWKQKHGYVLAHSFGLSQLKPHQVIGSRWDSAGLWVDGAAGSRTQQTVRFQHVAGHVIQSAEPLQRVAQTCRLMSLEVLLPTGICGLWSA